MSLIDGGDSYLVVELMWAAVAGPVAGISVKSLHSGGRPDSVGPATVSGDPPTA